MKTPRLSEAGRGVFIWGLQVFEQDFQCGRLIIGQVDNVKARPAVLAISTWAFLSSTGMSRFSGRLSWNVLASKARPAYRLVLRERING